MSHITGATLLEYWCWSGCGWDTALEIGPALFPINSLKVHAAAFIFIPGPIGMICHPIMPFIIRHYLGVMTWTAEDLGRVTTENDLIVKSFITSYHGHPGTAHKRPQRAFGTTDNDMVSAPGTLATGALRSEKIVILPSLVDIYSLHKVTGDLDGLAARLHRQTIVG